MIINNEQVTNVKGCGWDLFGMVSLNLHVETKQHTRLLVTQ